MVTKKTPEIWAAIARECPQKSGTVKNTTRNSPTDLLINSVQGEQSG